MPATDEFGGVAVDTGTDEFGGRRVDAGVHPPISGHDVFIPGIVQDQAKPFVNSTTVGNIIKTFGYEFGQNFGQDKLGMSDKNIKFMHDIGLTNNDAMGAFIGGPILNGAAVLDGIIRGANAAFRATQATASQELGLGDIAYLPDALAGSPHITGTFRAPTFKELVANLKEPKPTELINPIASQVPDIPSLQGIFGEQENAPFINEPPTLANVAGLANPWPTPPTSDGPVVTAAVQQAHDLGIIGPEKPTLADLADKPPEEAAATLKPEHEDTPAQEGNTYDWEARFKHFVGRLDQPQDVKDLILNSAEENDNFPAARQGILPLSDAQNLADAAGVDVSEINRDKVGQLLPLDQHVRTAMQTMIQMTRNVKDAARDLLTDTNNEQNLIKFQEHLLRRDMAVETVVGLRAQWGRAGNVLQEFMRDVKDGEALDNFIQGKCPL